MHISDNNRRQRQHSEKRTTIELTAIISLLLLAIAWLVPLETRNAAGERRDMSALDIWREMLRNVPDDVPFFLSSGIVAGVSILALIIAAYVIVAISRLPR